MSSTWDIPPPLSRTNVLICSVCHNYYCKCWCLGCSRKREYCICKSRYGKKSKVKPPPHPKKSRTKKIIDLLWAKQNGICYLCDGEMIKEYGHRQLSASVDHVIPKSKMGSNNITNLKLAHTGCNTRKGSMSQEEYLALVNNEE